MTAGFRRKLSLFGIGASFFGLLLDLAFWHNPCLSMALLALNLSNLLVAEKDLQLDQLRAMIFALNTGSGSEEKN